MKILLTYSTTDGHTIRICERIKAVVEDQGQELAIVPLAEVSPELLLDFDRIIIGASIRYGKHQVAVSEFISEHRALLNQKGCGFFSVNLVARKENKNTADTNPYVVKFLKRTDWQPTYVDVFAGKINYPIYSWSDRRIIQFIMWITSGPTDPSTVKEFTDWDRVEAFAKTISSP